MKRRHFLNRTCAGLLGAFGLVAGSRAGPGAAPQRADSKAPALAPLTLFLAGDVMLGRGVDQILPHPGNPELDEESSRTATRYVELAESANGAIPRAAGFDYIWGDALQELEAMAPAVRLINLETSVTTSPDAWPRKPVRYRMNPANIPVLEAARIDGVSLANNHVLDYGYSGLTQTLESLQQAGIRTAGAGPNLAEASAPAVFDTGGGRVLLFAAATGTSGVPPEWAARPTAAGVNRIDLFPWNVQQLAAQVHAVKQAGDIAVLSLHWGSNWGYEVERDQRKFAHRVIEEAGIDLVHGHSSHHPRGIELHRNKIILYGCGDLINDYEGITPRREEFRSELTLMYFPTLNRATGEVVQFEVAPMRVAHMRLQRASQEEAGWLTARLDRESRTGWPMTLKENGRIEVIPPSTMSSRP